MFCLFLSQNNKSYWAKFVTGNCFKYANNMLSKICKLYLITEWFIEVTYRGLLVFKSIWGTSMVRGLATYTVQINAIVVTKIDIYIHVHSYITCTKFCLLSSVYYMFCVKWWIYLKQIVRIFCQNFLCTAQKLASGLSNWFS